MISNQNPIALFRRLVSQVRGIEKAEEWKIYMAVAFLSMAISLLFMVYSAWFAGMENKEAAASVNQNRHLTLSGEGLVQKGADAAPVQSVLKERKAEPAKPVKKPRVRTQSEEWYYDSVHKDWRYKKQEKKG